MIIILEFLFLIPIRSSSVCTIGICRSTRIWQILLHNYYSLLFQLVCQKYLLGGLIIE